MRCETCGESSGGDGSCGATADLAAVTAALAVWQPSAHRSARIRWVVAV